jgi:ribosomal-protein-alanine acetyltransferase
MTYQVKVNMSVSQYSPQLRDMCWADLDRVLGIEQQVHRYPWTRGNFNDALNAGNICKVYEEANEIIGYAVMLPAPCMVDLLDISIASSYQRKGLGVKFLGELLAYVHSLKFERVILEVRQSNDAAKALYRRVGFSEIGLRRGYYPGWGPR